MGTPRKQRLASRDVRNGRSNALGAVPRRAISVTARYRDREMDKSMDKPMNRDRMKSRRFSRIARKAMCGQLDERQFDLFATVNCSISNLVHRLK